MKVLLNGVLSKSSSFEIISFASVLNDTAR